MTENPALRLVLRTFGRLLVLAGLVAIGLWATGSLSGWFDSFSCTTGSSQQEAPCAAGEKAIATAVMIGVAFLVGGLFWGLNRRNPGPSLAERLPQPSAPIVIDLRRRR